MKSTCQYTTVKVLVDESYLSIVEELALKHGGRFFFDALLLPKGGKMYIYGFTDGAQRQLFIEELLDVTKENAKVQ